MLSGLTFLDFPREIRDMIYSYFLEPIDFTMFSPRLMLPNMGESFLKQEEFIEENGSHAQWIYMPNYWPLLAVNKQVYSEAKQAIGRLTTVVSDNIKRGRLPRSIDPDFRSICESGRFIFDVTAEDAMPFMEKNRRRAGRHIRSIVITLNLLMADDGPCRRAWSKPSHTDLSYDAGDYGEGDFEDDDFDFEDSDAEDPDGDDSDADHSDVEESVAEDADTEDSDDEYYTPFTSALLWDLPQVREVAICLARPGTTQADMYCSHAPTEMCDLLEKGYLDTVRFLYETCERNAPKDCRYMKEALYPRPRWDRSMDFAEYDALCEEHAKRPPRFVATCEKLINKNSRDDGIPPFNWSRILSVWALRRPSAAD